jgi:hypothetical protein
LSDLKKVLSLIHNLADQNKLLTDKNKGLCKVLTAKKKHKKKDKVLGLQQREEYHCGAVF